MFLLAANGVDDSLRSVETVGALEPSFIIRSPSCPANLNDELTKKIQKVAEDACNAIGCEPYARADVMMDADGNMFCLEVNTLPGMTATSLVPQEAKAVGMDFPTLCDYLVELSLKKNN